MENVLPGPRKMDTSAPNVAVTWGKWKQEMEFTMMRRNTEEKYCMFLFLIGERGRDVFNTVTWEKKRNADGNPTDEDGITVRQLFINFEDYYLAKMNLIVERRKFFWKN